MKKRALLPIVLVIAILFCGCVSNFPGSNSVRVTSPTITSQNPDDLYFQYIAEYENGYLNIITPYMSLKMQDSSDYANMKSTFTELRISSMTYQEKIEPLNVSSKYELSKKYYLESLKQRQLYSEATLAGPYPNNPSNSVEVDSFNNYMISLRPYINSAKIFFNNAMITDVCTNLFEKQNYSVSDCNSNNPQKISITEDAVNPSARNAVLANPTHYCIGAGGYVEWREGRAVSGIFCIPYAQKNYPKCDVGTGPVVFGPNGIICGD